MTIVSISLESVPERDPWRAVAKALKEAELYEALAEYLQQVFRPGELGRLPDGVQLDWTTKGQQSETPQRKPAE